MHLDYVRVWLTQEQSSQNSGWDAACAGGVHSACQVPSKETQHCTVLLSLDASAPCTVTMKNKYCLYQRKCISANACRLLLDKCLWVVYPPVHGKQNSLSLFIKTDGITQNRFTYFSSISNKREATMWTTSGRKRRRAGRWAVLQSRPRGLCRTEQPSTGTPSAALTSQVLELGVL